jgi:hypothetical protein
LIKQHSEIFKDFFAGGKLSDISNFKKTFYILRNPGNEDIVAVDEELHKKKIYCLIFHCADPVILHMLQKKIPITNKEHYNYYKQNLFISGLYNAYQNQTQGLNDDIAPSMNYINYCPIEGLAAKINQREEYAVLGLFL